jgi:glycerol-3-phosphate dehydrogenase (NAD(P)+)
MSAQGRPTRSTLGFGPTVSGATTIANVIGDRAGSWGTALVKLLTGTQRNRWAGGCVRQETIDHITKYGHNPDYTSGAQFDVKRLAMDTDIRAVVKAADVLVIAVPSAFLKTAMDQLEPAALKGKTCFSAVKGIVPETNQIVGEYLFEHWGVQKNDFGIICGPCHAEEVALERLELPHHRQPRSRESKAHGRCAQWPLPEDHP